MCLKILSITESTMSRLSPRLKRKIEWRRQLKKAEKERGTSPSKENKQDTRPKKIKSLKNKRYMPQNSRKVLMKSSPRT